MDSGTLTVLAGNHPLFRSFADGMVLLPTNEPERANVIRALRSALDLLEARPPELPQAKGYGPKSHST